MVIFATLILVVGLLVVFLMGVLALVTVTFTEMLRRRRGR